MTPAFVASTGMQRFKPSCLQCLPLLLHSLPTVTWGASHMGLHASKCHILCWHCAGWA